MTIRIPITMAANDAGNLCTLKKVRRGKNQVREPNTALYIFRHFIMEMEHTLKVFLLLYRLHMKQKVC